MTIFYLKDHVCEELDGARDYIKKALHLKGESLERARQFYDMSNAELEHARALYKMFCEDYKDIDVSEELEHYMSPFKEELEESFMESVGAVKYMQEMFNKQN